MQTKNVTPGEFISVSSIADRIIKHDREYLSALMQELISLQPDFTAGMMESVTGLRPEETDDILTLYLVVWGFSRQFSSCRGQSVGHQQFDRVQKKNISMFRYLDQEDDLDLFGEIVYSDQNNPHFRLLMKFISDFLLSRPSLTNMNPKTFVHLFIDLKSYVGCFEELVTAGDEKERMSA